MKLLRCIIAGGFFLGVGPLVYAFMIEPRRLVVNEVDLSTPAWQGPDLRIAFISDTHTGGAHVSARRVARIVERINALDPDIVLLGGDYVDSHKPANAHSERFRAEISAGIAAFGYLDAECGVVAVLGNHDWWYDGPSIKADLLTAGVTVLENNYTSVNCKGTSIAIAGLADRMTRFVDIHGTVDRIPAGLPVLLLAHNPDDFIQLPARVPIMLAGHTHGGQVYIPGIGRPVVPSDYGQRFAYGRIDYGEQRLYVTAGIGESLMPVRFGVPPEIVVLSIRRTPTSP